LCFSFQDVFIVPCKDVVLRICNAGLFYETDIWLYE